MARPPWVPTQEHLEKVESYASLGLTKEQIASCLGIGKTTLYDKSIEYPEFAAAIKRGLDKGIARYANLLLKHAEGGSVPSVIFFLKCRAKWNDQPESDLQRTIQQEIQPIREMIAKWNAENN